MAALDGTLHEDTHRYTCAGYWRHPLVPFTCLMEQNRGSLAFVWLFIELDETSSRHTVTTSPGGLIDAPRSTDKPMTCSSSSSCLSTLGVVAGGTVISIVRCMNFLRSLRDDVTRCDHRPASLATVRPAWTICLARSRSERPSGMKRFPLLALCEMKQCSLSSNRFAVMSRRERTS